MSCISLVAKLEMLHREDPGPRTSRRARSSVSSSAAGTSGLGSRLLLRAVDYVNAGLSSSLQIATTHK